ncbi:hypothetical protein ACFL1E_03755 [Candidatus Omnitrophota bacterium]
MNKKSIIEFVITGILVLVLIGLVVNQMKKSKSAPRARKHSVDEIMAKEMLFAKGNSAATIDTTSGGLFERLEREAEGFPLMRDPFVFGPPRPDSPLAVQSLHLQGVIWDEKTPQAVINDNIVGIGDSLGAHTVKQIKPDSVVVSDGTNDFELKLWEQIGAE